MSMEAYRNLFSRPFFMERLEVQSLAKMMQICIKVWINPRTMECFGNTDKATVNLLLRSQHFSPILRENGDAHLLELRKLSKTFHQPHLSLDNPAPTNSNLRASIGNANIITINSSSSGSEAEHELTETWQEIKHRRKKDSDRIGRGKKEKSQTSVKQSSVSTAKTLGDLKVQNQSSDNPSSGLSLDSLQKSNPFKEHTWGGRVNRLSFGDSLPRRTLLQPSPPKENAQVPKGPKVCKGITRGKSEKQPSNKQQEHTCILQ